MLENREKPTLIRFVPDCNKVKLLGKGDLEVQTYHSSFIDMVIQYYVTFKLFKLLFLSDRQIAIRSWTQLNVSTCYIHYFLLVYGRSLYYQYCLRATVSNIAGTFHSKLHQNWMENDVIMLKSWEMNVFLSILMWFWIECSCNIPP